MDKLHKYLAHIPNENRDAFDVILDKLSHASNNNPGARIGAIVPLNVKTIYEISLSEEEAMVMSLSCPGLYRLHTDDDERNFMIAYLNEREL